MTSTGETGTPAGYAAFVARTCSSWPPQIAARIIERECHPPLPERLTRGPVVVPERAEGDGAA